MKLTRLSAVVLVVIVLLATAIALPAISASREASRRMQCASNIKELLIALQNYHDTFLYLPYGARNRWQLTTPLESSWGPSWLPVTKHFSTYLIHTSLLDRMIAADQKSPQNDYISATVREQAHQVKIDFMACPSSPLPRTQTLSGFELMVPSYAGIMGAAPFDELQSVNQTVTSTPESRAVPGPYDGWAAGNGLLLINESLTMAACTDGTANAIVIGEVSDWYYTDRGEPRNPALSIADAGDGFHNEAGWMAGTNVGFNRRKLSAQELEVLSRHPHATPESVPHLQGQLVHQSEPPLTADRVCNLISIYHPVGRNNRLGPGDDDPNWGTQGIGRCGFNNPLLSAHPTGAMVGYLDAHVQLMIKKTSLDVLKRLAVRDDGGWSGGSW
jgi:hypothetical protein